MSGEKIDLADVEKYPPFVPGEVLSALVAAVKFSNSGHVADRMALDAALSPFTDSAEVRSDGE
jgi:hypothetical protein